MKIKSILAIAATSLFASSFALADTNGPAASQSPADTTAISQDDNSAAPNAPAPQKLASAQQQTSSLTDPSDSTNNQSSTTL